MRIAFEVDDQDLRRGLQEDRERWGDLRGALERLGQALLERQRENVETAGATARQSWPELAPKTRAIRAHYGHGRRPLVRRGDLLASLAYRVEGDTAVSGSPLPYADVLDAGGRVPGSSRTVPAFPFLAPTETDHDAYLELALDHLAGEAS